VSSRIRSEFGTLGERTTPPASRRSERPVDPARHVWITTASGRHPGLLVAWVPAAGGAWFGKVALADQPGEASLQLLDSSLLTPASTDSDVT